MITKETNIAFFFLLLSLILRGLPTCLLQQCLFTQWGEEKVKMHSSWKSRGGRGGSLGVLAKFFLDAYLGLSKKSRGSPFCILLPFYVKNFWILPPPSPCPHPPCASLRKSFLKIKPWFTLSAFFSICLFFTSFTAITVD